MEKHKKTSLLPPSTAVRMAWACTGTFTREGHSKFYTSLVDEAMKDIKSPLRKKGNENKNTKEIEQIENEKKYLTRAKAAMSACLRSIHTIYSGRNLNFDENKKLRETYLESVKESIDFGNKLKDFLKSLPTMTFGAVSGAAIFEKYVKPSLETLAEELAEELPEDSVTLFLEKFTEDSALLLWILVVLGIVIGYIINDLVIVKWTRKRKQMLYVIHDYERNIYYESYLDHVAALLKSLYRDVDQIHDEVFREPYLKEEGEEKEKKINEIVSNLIDEARPKRCKHVYRHMKEKKITPGLWILCETGYKEGLERCPHWRYEGKSEKNEITGIQKLWYKIRNIPRKIPYIRLEY